MITAMMTALLAGAPVTELDTGKLNAALEQARANGCTIISQDALTNGDWAAALEKLGADPSILLDCPQFSLPECDLPVGNLPGGGAAEGPETEVPETEVPGTEAPETETPGTEVPETETPNTDKPGEIPPESEKPSVPEQGEGTEALAMAEKVAKLVNQERAKAGLSPLEFRTDISAAAQVRAVETQTSFSHTRPDGRGFSTALTDQKISFSGSGENIAWGQQTPEAVMKAWMNSEGHRANILKANYKYIGVGYHTNSQGTPYWTQLFTY